MAAQPHLLQTQNNARMGGWGSDVLAHIEKVYSYWYVLIGRYWYVLLIVLVCNLVGIGMYC